MINPIQKHCATDTIRNQNKTKKNTSNKTKTRYSARRALQNTHQTKQKHVILPDERTPPNEDNYTNPHPTQSQNHQRWSRLKTEPARPSHGPQGTRSRTSQNLLLLLHHLHLLHLLL